MFRHYITDRTLFRDADALLRSIAAALQDNITAVQIREKDLSARDLYELTRAIIELPNPHGARILVNTRVDLALAAGADGAHLPSKSMPPSTWRALVPPGFQIGVSCHSTADLRRALAEGADYAYYSPIFASPGKTQPVGLTGLAEACASVPLPVLALGGVTLANAPSCVAAGAAGIAGIRLFADSFLP